MAHTTSVEVSEEEASESPVVEAPELSVSPVLPVPEVPLVPVAPELPPEAVLSVVEDCCVLGATVGCVVKSCVESTLPADGPDVTVVPTPGFTVETGSAPPLKSAENSHTSKMMNHMAESADRAARITMSKRSRFHKIQMPSGGKMMSSAHISHSVRYKKP